MGHQYYYKVRPRVTASGPEVAGGATQEAVGDYSNEAGDRADYPQPSSLSISPGVIEQGSNYTITAGNGNNMTLDIKYLFNGIGPYEIDAWPPLNQNGQYVQPTNSSTAPGTYTFVEITNHENNCCLNWVPTNAGVTVTYPNPTGLGFDRSFVAQGDRFLTYVGNGANMTIDVQYRYNQGPVGIAGQWASLDENGQAWSYTAGVPTGLWEIVGVRNSMNGGAFVPVYASITVY